MTWWMDGGTLSPCATAGGPKADATRDNATAIALTGGVATAQSLEWRSFSGTVVSRACSSGGDVIEAATLPKVNVTDTLA
jgi:hypothetical protein